MIYLKMISRKTDKYIKDEKKENIKKLETNILKILFQVVFKKMLKTIKNDKWVVQLGKKVRD